MNTLKVELIEKITVLLNELNLSKPPQESLEWYLLSNLNQYLHSIDVASDHKEISNSTKIFSGFCTESMNWDTELYRKCVDITKVGFQLSKGR
jgi:hypothetical protein